MAEKRIGKTLKPYVQKARDSALLAVEIYNKPAIAFKSSGYISLMVIAWTALLHAIHLREGARPFYKGVNGRFLKVDGDFKHWELAECAKQFWKAEPDNPARKNLEFFIPLRNRIEHRYLPELDGALFGECQALLLNFDELLGKHFGAGFQLRQSLSFSLQLFPSGESFAQAVKKNKQLADVKAFIDGYRSMISAEVAGSSQFAFKAFLIQVANHSSADTLPIQFIHQDKLTEEQKAEFNKFAVMVKFKDAGGMHAGLCKPGSVVDQVQQALGNPQVDRPGGKVNKFNLNVHARCWRHYKARPAGNAAKPEATNKDHCVYDPVHKDYLYSPAWVAFLSEKMKDDAEYAAVMA